jgi:hypothetical protein
VDLSGNGELRADRQFLEFRNAYDALDRPLRDRSRTYLKIV